MRAYLKLLDHCRAGWQKRTHFFAVAAQLIRPFLDARSRTAAERVAGVQP